MQVPAKLSWDNVSFSKMRPDSYKPPYDSARGQRAQSAYIATSLLVGLLRTGSIERILVRLGCFKEVLLFKFQIAAATEALRTNQPALDLWFGLLRQGVVFHMVEAKAHESLQLYTDWQVMQFEADYIADQWPIAVRMRELGLDRRLLLAKIRTGEQQVFLTDDCLERETAAHVGILCA